MEPEYKPAFHEIEANIKALLDAWDEAELTPEEEQDFGIALEASLAELADMEASKADGIAWVLGEMDAQIKHHAETIATIQSRKKSLENRRERLKEYVLAVFQANDIKKIKGESATLYLSSSESVRVDVPGDKIPRCYTKVSYAPDKKMLKDALKKGANIAGVSIQTNQSLAVRR